VSVWVSENQLILGEIIVDGESDEIIEFLELFDLFDVLGAIVTIDVVGCQMDVVERDCGERSGLLFGVEGGDQKSFV
jgi:predicted transposase YbfD/YdcC